MSYGANIKFGIARQASNGTAVTAAGSYHPIGLVSHDIGLEKEEVIGSNLTGRFEQGATYDGVARVLGTVEIEATPRALVALLAAAVTHSPSIVTSGSVRTLTFLPTTTDYDASFVKAPFSIYSQFADANSAEQFYDCQFGQIEFGLSQGQFLRTRATVVGGKRSVNGIGSLNVMPDIGDQSVLFPWNVASVAFDNVPMSQNSELTVTFNENVEALFTNNLTLEPYKYTRTGFREVTVGGTLYFTSRDLLSDFAAGTSHRLTVSVVNTRTAVQSGFYNTLRIDIPQVKLTSFKPSVNGPGEVAVSFTGRALLDATSNYIAQFILINTYAAGV